MNSPRFLQCHLAAANSLPSLLPTLPQSDPFWEAAFGIPPSPSYKRAHNSSCSSFEQGINSKNPAPLDLELHRQLHFQPHSLKIWFMNAALNFGHLQISQNLKEQLGFSFISIPNPATLCALEIFPSFPWHMLMLMAPPGTDFPASNSPPLFSTPLGMWQS